jgi:lipoprotein-anchoring transpeptidase ErfK/SrfK
LVPLAELRRRGLAITPGPNGLKKVRIKNRSFYARNGLKRVVVNKTHMEVRAWQGQRVVLASPVTMGIEGHETPSGIFKAQGYKAKMHKSKIYDNAPMPWAVHIVGNVFIHGWPNVEGNRASHGCIRLPLSGGNPARFFYYWVERGTPVSILGKWPRGAKGG